MSDCFHCGSKGRIDLVSVNLGYCEQTGGCKRELRTDIQCAYCSGTGRVRQEQVEAREMGNKIREYRRKHEILLIEMAYSLDMAPSKLSGMETGRIPMSEHVKARIDQLLAADNG